jgi:hypothetical protein
VHERVVAARDLDATHEVEIELVSPALVTVTLPDRAERGRAGPLGARLGVRVAVGAERKFPLQDLARR